MCVLAACPLLYCEHHTITTLLANESHFHTKIKGGFELPLALISQMNENKTIIYLHYCSSNQQIVYSY
jgi:hypothetical protein